MSFKHVHDVLESKIPKHLKLTAVVIAEFADLDTGECWPSIETIARRCSSNPRTAQRNIRELEEMGIVVRQGKHRSGTWKYRLVIPESEGVAFRRGDTHVTPRGDTGVRGGVTPTPPEPSLNHQGTINKDSRECPKDFIPSEKTVKTILEHHPELTPADLDDALKQMKAHPYSKPKKDWNAAFRTWVNNGVKWGSIGTGNGKATDRQQSISEIMERQRREIADYEGQGEGGEGVVASY